MNARQFRSWRRRSIVVASLFFTSREWRFVRVGRTLVMKIEFHDIAGFTPPQPRW